MSTNLLAPIPAETVITRNGVHCDVTVMVEQKADHSEFGGWYEVTDFSVSPTTTMGEVLTDSEIAFVAKSITDSLNDYQSARADEEADSVWESMNWDS